MIVESLKQSASEPLAVLAAHGHGRSYGGWSSVLVRSLPGIDGCGIWDELAETAESHRRPTALLTDIGNDLIYGYEVDQILGWVCKCLDRLAAHQTETILTLLPVASLFRLSAARFQCTRMLFFPGRRFSWTEMKKRIELLDAGLRNLADEYNILAIEPQQNWYGLDPIHIRKSRRQSAWKHIFSHWKSVPNSIEVNSVSILRQIEILRLQPHERRFFGRAQNRTQPIHSTPEGFSLSLY